MSHHTYDKKCLTAFTLVFPSSKTQQWLDYLFTATCLLTCLTTRFNILITPHTPRVIKYIYDFCWWASNLCEFNLLHLINPSNQNSNSRSYPKFHYEIIHFKFSEALKGKKQSPSTTGNEVQRRDSHVSRMIQRNNKKGWKVRKKVEEGHTWKSAYGNVFILYCQSLNKLFCGPSTKIFML